MTIDFETPRVTEGSLDEMVAEAAHLWDGATDQEWIDGHAVLVSQTIQIFELQKQSWHDDLFEEEVVCDWIEKAIRQQAVGYKEYVLTMPSAQAMREAAQHRGDTDTVTLSLEDLPTQAFDPDLGVVVDV